MGRPRNGRRATTARLKRPLALDRALALGDDADRGRWDAEEAPIGEATANGFVVDSDSHNVAPSARALFPYLTDRWRE